MTSERIIRTLLRLTKPLWKNRRFALWSEEIFWSRWIGKNRDRVRELTDPNLAFPDELLRYVEHVRTDPVEVLEVGAGPFSVIGSRHDARRFHVTATDVLAPQYDRMLARNRIEPPVRTIYADAEQLIPQFGLDAFDLVFATNCVDHMQRPVAAIGQMLSVVRKGGSVVLRHEVNEGLHQDYAGLHQWNLNAEGGRFIIWNEKERHDLTELLRDSCEVVAAIRDDILYSDIRKLVAGEIVIS
jgi:SAM-dependent methyltransferase